MTPDQLADLIGDIPVRFWTCLNRAHKTVTWGGDVATCDMCGLTSTDTARYQQAVREDERKRLLAAVRDAQQRGAQVRSTCRVIAERAYPCPTIRALDGEVTDG